MPMPTTGQLIRTDAVLLEGHVPLGSVELAYLDPPFAVGARFGARTGRGERAAGALAYDDRWPSLEAYLGWLGERLRVVFRLLSKRGTLWLHLDHRAVHEAKALCDGVFGKKHMLGEIIWIPGNGSRARRGPGRTHQTLLVYARSNDFVWNGSDPALRAPFAETSLAMHFTNQDEQGRAYRDRTIGGKTYRYYADAGRALGSVWFDCPSMVANTPLLSEATGYPTQKPLKLLDRIVRASSGPRAVVLDPFCGSGTTLVAAARLGRRFFGADIGELAMKVTAERLTREKIPFARIDGINSKLAPTEPPRATSPGRRARVRPSQGSDRAS